MRLPRASSFAGLPDGGDLFAYAPGGAARHDGAYTWHAAQISEAHAFQSLRSGTLRITSPSGQPLQYRYVRHIEHPSGDWTWVGRLDDGEQFDEAIITFGERAAFGSISEPGKPDLRLTTWRGAAWLVETDPTKIADIRNESTRPSAPDYLLPPAAVAAVADSSRTSAGTGSAPATANAVTAAAATTVDVVLGYTSGFAASLGGQSQAITRLNNLVEIANQAYLNSQVDAEIRLVHALQVQYPDATTNASALESLTGYRSGTGGGQIAVDPAFSALRAARDQYGGDLVTLVRKFETPENDGCGIAWLIGGGRSGLDTGDAPFGYSVVSDGQDVGSDGRTYFCRQETLAHELGHNMGSQHDRVTATENGTLNYGVFTYSFGYKAAATAGNFYTVMAYGDTGQIAYRVFSNPRISFCGGLACGVAEEADNARSLAQTMPVVAQFRGSVVAPPPPPPPPPPTARRVASDVNGDGRSDILWHNAVSGELYYWAMNGASIAGGQGSATLPMGFAAIGSGDFNGDGRADVLSSSVSEVRVSLALDTGAYGAATSLSGRPSAGWTFAGAGDVNGDGRSEILWHNVISGELYWWVVNGAVITGGQGGSSVPVGYSVLGLGDLNGDGRVDLLTANSADVRVSFAQANGALAAPVVIAGRPPAGWRFAGAADVNGDARSDVVWHNTNSGELYYWAMNGSTIAGGQGAAYLAEGHAVLGLGDFNGDGRADVLSAGSADVRVSFSLGAALASPSLVAARPPSGWSHVGASRRNDGGPLSDVSGDTRSDMIWHNINSGELYYWAMSGASIAGGQGAAYLPMGYETLAFADFNGDGRADVLSASSVDVRISLAQGTGSFGASATISARPPAGWSLAGAGDVNGDARADVIWHNVNSGELYYWAMSGASIAGGQGAAYLPIGHSAIGVGDVNGDGRVDVISASSADVRISLALGAGSFGAATAISTRPPAGWNFSGSGDVDGNGKWDIIWHNVNSGELYYWAMSGAAIVGGQGAAYLPPGHTTIGIGDFNGDGRSDIVSANVVEVRVSLAQGAASFGPSAYVSTRPPAGWRLVSVRP